MEEAAEVLAISRTLMYAHLKSGVVESLKIGRRRFVPAKAVDAYVRTLLEQPTPPRGDERS